MRKIVCDVCGEDVPNFRHSFKFRRNLFTFSHSMSLIRSLTWEKVDLCRDCIDEIIIVSRTKAANRKRLV